MEKQYYIVDATAPGDNSIVKLDGDKGIFSLEEAETFISANQADLEVPTELDGGVIITKRYNLFEAPEVLPPTE